VVTAYNAGDTKSVTIAADGRAAALGTVRRREGKLRRGPLATAPGTWRQLPDAAHSASHPTAGGVEQDAGRRHAAEILPGDALTLRSMTAR
jgi:hypothetical protein